MRKKSKLFAIAVAFLCMFCMCITFSSCKEETTNRAVYEVSTDGTYARLVEYTGSSAKVEIAKTYKGVPVTEIDERAFVKYDHIQELVIPDTVNSLAQWMLWHCTVEKATLPACAVGCFDKSLLEWVKITSGEALGGDPLLGEYGFSGCTNLKTVELSASLGVLKNDAFRGCTALTSITFAKESVLTAIGAYAFLDCEQLTEIIIPQGVTQIGEGAFKGCARLQKVVLPDSLTRIEDGTFNGCRALADICIPQSVTYIGSSAFFQCAALKALDLPDGLTVIGGRAFAECDGLSQLTLARNIYQIGHEAFADCGNLENVIFFINMDMVVYSDWFSGCDKLERLYIRLAEEDWQEVLSILQDDFRKGMELWGARIYWYSAVPPTLDGDFWFYDVNGVPVVWE